MSSLNDFKLTLITGQEYSLSRYEGKLLLFVNTASKCGFTPQYEGLEKLYQKYKDDLVILAFPCNQFGSQERGDHKQIMDFCKFNYGVSFPIHKKIDVNGAGEDPLFTYLKKKAPGLLGSKKIKWNFTKFLVSKDRKQIQRFSSIDTPKKIEASVKKLI